MRFIFAAVALLVVLCASAAPTPQDVKIVFGAPTSGGAPSGYRLFKDGVLVGPLVSGQVFTALQSDDGTSHVLGIEAVNAACGAAGLPACTRVNTPLQINPGLQPPGPVITITITSPCTSATPPCTIIVGPSQ